MRLLSQSHVNFDLNSYFAQYGLVEKAYFVPESEINIPGKYTIIGYVLFDSKEVAEMLIQEGVIEFKDFTVLIKEIQNKNEKKGQSSLGKQSKNDKKLTKNKIHYQSKHKPDRVTLNHPYFMNNRQKHQSRTRPQLSNSAESNFGSSLSEHSIGPFDQFSKKILESQNRDYFYPGQNQFRNTQNVNNNRGPEKNIYPELTT